MRNVKKNMLIVGAVAIALLLVSSTTAVAQVESEILMEKIEELEEFMDEHNLAAILNADELDEESLQVAMGYLNDFLVEQGIPGFDVQELANDFDAEGYMDYLLSDEFVELFTHDDIQDLLDGDEYKEYFINDETVISFVHSEYFYSFVVSDFAQQLLENIEEGDDSAVPGGQSTALPGSQTTSTTQQAPLNTGGENLVIDDTGTFGSVQIPQADPEDANTLFNAMLIGLFANIILDIEPLPVGPIIEIILYLISNWLIWQEIMLIFFTSAFGVPVATILLIIFVIIDAIALITGIVLVGVTGIVLAALTIYFLPVLVILYILAVIIVFILSLFGLA